MALLVLLNNFLHDFSAAGWIFGLIFLGVLLKRAKTTGGHDPALGEIISLTILLMKLSLGGIVLFGIFRLLAYRAYEWNAAAGQGQLTLLAIKHVFLFGLVFWGLRLMARAKKMGLFE